MITFIVCFASLSISTVHHPISFVAFGWIWMQNIALHTSECTLLPHHIINKHQWPISTSNHTCSYIYYLHYVWQMIWFFCLFIFIYLCHELFLSFFTLFYPSISHHPFIFLMLMLDPFFLRIQHFVDLAAMFFSISLSKFILFVKFKRWPLSHASTAHWTLYFGFNWAATTCRFKTWNQLKTFNP